MEKKEAAAAAAVIAMDDGEENNHNHKQLSCRQRRRRCGSARPPRGRRRQDYWRQQHGRCRSAPPPPRQGRRRANRMMVDWTSEEHQAAREFKRIAGEEILKYVRMTDAEVVEGYRLAGKLHRYNPLSEMQKRIAWVARRYPPPDGYYPFVEEEFFRFIDDTDDMGCEISRFTVTYHRPGCRDAPFLPCTCKVWR